MKPISLSPLCWTLLLASGCDSSSDKPSTIDTAISSTDTDAPGDTAADTGTGDTDDSDCAGEATDDDRDGDGIPNDIESDTSNLNPDSADSNGDGTCDGEEDTDGDGLTNLEEVALGTSPGASDTDGDGYPDGYENSNGSSPNDSNVQPSLNAELLCENANATKANHFSDLDDDGREDNSVEDYYGDDYRRGFNGYECTCTINLPEGYARVVDLAVFTPTAVHNNSPWESKSQPAIGAIKVPFKTSSRSDGVFLLSNIYQSTTVDTHNNSVPHWFAEPTDLISSEEVVSIGGDYTVWISVKNPKGQLIEADDDDFSEGCTRLSGNSADSGYEGFLRISLSNTKFTANGSASSATSCSDRTEQTHAMLLWGEANRLRLLGVGGSEKYTDNLITQLEVADWNSAEKVQIAIEDGPAFLLTPDQPSVTLPNPTWLGRIRVQADMPTGTTLPTLDLTHKCTDQPPPRLDGQRHPLSWRSLDTFLTSANSLLSVEDILPSDAALDMSALNARIAEPPDDQPGPTWLHLDARGGGPLMSIPLAPDANGGWTFDVRTNDFTAQGALSVGNNGALSITLEEGTFGALTLDEATFTVETD